MVLLLGGGSSKGHWEIVPEQILTTTSTTKVNPTGTSRSQREEDKVAQIVGPVVMVVNSTNVNGFGAELSNTLNYIGIRGPKIIKKKRIEYRYGNLVSPPGEGLRNQEYIMGLRKEIVVDKNRTSIPADLLLSANMHLKDPNTRITEKIENVSAVSYSQLMGYSSKSSLVSTSITVDENFLGIEEFKAGAAPNTSIIYYLPEYKDWVEKKFVLLLNKLNGRMLNKNNFIVYNKAMIDNDHINWTTLGATGVPIETLNDNYNNWAKYDLNHDGILDEAELYNSQFYQYKLQQAPSSLASVMRNGLNVVIDNLDYVYQKLLNREFTFNRSFYTIDPGGYFPFTSLLNNSTGLNDVFTAVKKWPANTPTPNGAPSNHWGQVITLDKKVYPIKLSVTTISPFNVMLILGLETVLDTKTINFNLPIFGRSSFLDSRPWKR